MMRWSTILFIPYVAVEYICIDFIWDLELIVSLLEAQIFNVHEHRILRFLISFVRLSNHIVWSKTINLEILTNLKSVQQNFIYLLITAFDLMSYQIMYHF